MKNVFKREGGFTLFELLVAIAILSVVTTIGLRSFVLMTSSWKERRAMMRLNENANAVFVEIGRDLADTLSAELSGHAIRGYDEFAEGSGFNSASDHDDRIVIPVQESLGSTLKTARTVQWRVLRDENDRNALYRSVGVLGADSPANRRTDFMPETNVVRFDVAYATGKEDSPWVSSWTSDEHPHAVRVSITLSDLNYPFRQISRKEVYTVHVR